MTLRRVVALLLVLALVGAGAVAAVVAVRDAGDAGDAGSGSARPDGEGEPADPGEPVAADPDDGEPPSPELAAFYGQEPAWEPCRDSFECATITVPVDYADPEGETFELALLKVPASGERIGSLVVNPGGPGAPGTSYAASADQVFRQPLLDSFDIVGFDPRGTGDSSPVDCLSDTELDAYIAADPAPDDAAEVERTEELLDDFGQGCVENSGPIIEHVTTIEAARDMDVLRSALGESTLTYLGASYGTKLGATYAELFPERVGRFVLDGAVDVTLDNRELGLEQAGGFETAIRAYVENCIDSADDCFLGDSVEEGLATISDFLAQVDREPLPTDSDRQLEVGNAFYGIITPLYNRDYWFILSSALRAALDGDGSQLLLLSDAYSSRNPDGSYADNSSEAIFAINCLDDPSSVSFDQVEGEFGAFEEESPTFGRIFAWSLAGCSAQRAESTEEPLEIRAEGAAPILVVGTTRDPATPYAWAEALADQLDSGVLLSRDGDGHTAYNSGNECIDETIESYLVAGTVPDDGTSC